ncbi:hypothetical protein PG999_003964 [Apiospora kogelbergensis]|uniref:Ecp2 effector protein-like domain-containing protein n=1 Tax=Apiospora kogelbergensis TaxID=1337665 RepID=A0AAW0R597_9PEZI
MQLLAILATLLLAAFQVQAAAISMPSSVTPNNKAATAGVQRFQSPFLSTPGPMQVCSIIGSKLKQVPPAIHSVSSMTSNFAREADCQELADYVNDNTGYWDTSDWASDSNAHTISTAGTCILRISVPSLPGGNGHIWIGNADVGHAVGQAVAGQAHGGQVAAMGQITCQYPNGDTVVNFSISA